MILRATDFMKKTFLFLTSLCALCCCGGSLRIDITGLDEQIRIKSSVPGTSQSAKPQGKLLQKTSILPSANDWKEFQLTFTPLKSGVIYITLRGTNEDPVLVDGFSAIGANLKNGNFETLTPAKTFAVWRSSSKNVVSDPKLVKEGKYCARVTYTSRLNLKGLKVTADTPVTLKGFFRNEKPAPAQSDLRKKLALPPDSNVVFDPTFDKNKPLVISSGRLELHPTFENCSVYLNLLPEERNKKLKVEFFYRKAGKGTYLPTLPPAEVVQEHAWRGSVFNLEENTAYDFKALITAQGYKKEVKGNFRTLNSKVPFETVVLQPGKCTVKITSGTPDKYKRYTSKGKVITAVNGSEAVFLLKDLKYIIFDDMVIDAQGAQNGFKLDNCSNIIIRNCEVYNFGRKSAGPRYGASMYYNGGMHDATGKLLYDDLAFRLFQTRNVLIERCFVHDPAYPSQTWLYAHPSGPGCIKVMDCRNTVVRWNDFVGRDERRFIDHIIGPPNGSLRGGFARDADIYGNFFAFSNDDAAELEGGAMNIRCYGNRIEGTLSGMSTGPISLGPSYLIGNLFTNPGDDDGTFSQPYKNGGGTKGVNHTRGKYYALNNTVGDSWVSKYGMGNFSEPHKEYFPSCKAYLRNNILRCSGRFYHRLWHTFNTDCNGNLLERIPGVDPELIAKDMEAIKKSGHEKQGIYAKATYNAPLTGDYSLRKNAPGYGKAMIQNNFPNFKHCGAYEGYAHEWFPKRPLHMYADKTELHWLKGDFSLRTIKVTAPGAMKFKAIASDSFFAVTQKSCKASGKNKEYIYTVKLLPEKMKTPRRYSGAILFRNEAGLALPVTLFADGRIPLEKAISDPLRFIRARKISAKMPKYVFEVSVPAPGTYFMMVRGQYAPNLSSGKVNLTCDGQSFKRELPKASAEWMLLKSFKFRRLVPFELPAGKKKFEFESLNGVTIREVVLTREPWVLLRNREYAVKGVK